MKIPDVCELKISDADVRLANGLAVTEVIL